LIYSALEKAQYEALLKEVGGFEEVSVEVTHTYDPPKS
jgi:hypothetical protein